MLASDKLCLRFALAYVEKIVVEKDGYPVYFTAGELRILLINAFISGSEIRGDGAMESTVGFYPTDGGSNPPPRSK